MCAEILTHVWKKFDLSSAAFFFLFVVFDDFVSDYVGTFPKYVTTFLFKS